MSTPQFNTQPEHELFPPVLSPEQTTALHDEYEVMQERLWAKAHEEYKSMREKLSAEADIMIDDGIKDAIGGIETRLEQASNERFKSCETEINKKLEYFQRQQQISLQKYRKTAQPAQPAPPPPQMDSAQVSPPPSPVDYSENPRSQNISGILQKYSIPIISILVVIIFSFIINSIWFSKDESKTTQTDGEPVPVVPPAGPAVDIHGNPLGNASPKHGGAPSPIPAGTPPANSRLGQSLSDLKSAHNNSYVSALNSIINNPSAKGHSQLKALMKKISDKDADGLDGTSHTVTKGQRGRIAGYVKQSSSSWNVHIVKVVLFEYLAAIKCKNSDCGNQKITVNLGLSDITETISSVLNQSLPQSARFEPVPPAQRTNKEYNEFMAAVVLAHIM